MKKVIIFIVYPVALVFLIPYALKIDWGLPVAEWIGVFGIIFFLKTFAEDFEDFAFVVDDNGVNFVNTKTNQTSVPKQNV